jgi:hypothetical protein
MEKILDPSSEYFEWDSRTLIVFSCNELQDIHYQGRELREAAAPIGYH